jgi:hypothetical protein
MDAKKQPQRKSAGGTLTAGQRAYESRRAAKAGVSLEKWLAMKDKEAAAEARARAKAAEKQAPPKPPGFWRRLLDRAHQPIRK